MTKLKRSIIHLGKSSIQSFPWTDFKASFTSLCATLFLSPPTCWIDQLGFNLRIYLIASMRWPNHDKSSDLLLTVWTIWRGSPFRITCQRSFAWKNSVTLKSARHLARARCTTFSFEPQAADTTSPSSFLIMKPILILFAIYLRLHLSLFLHIFLFQTAGCLASLFLLPCITSCAKEKSNSMISTTLMTLMGLLSVFSKTNSFLLSQILLIVIAIHSKTLT